MAITSPVYATRETVKRALDIKETARANEQVDRLLEAGSRTIDGDLHRVFYPRLQTLRWDCPDSQSGRPWRLWLDDHELISVSALVSGGVTVPASDYLLYPDDGPPYDRLEIDRSSSSAFSVGDTGQKATVITGLWGGAPLTLADVGALVAAINSSVGALTVLNGALVGIGDLLLIDSEYLLVTDRGWLTSTQTVQTPLTASAANTTVAVTTGSAFSNGEVILLDAETMLIVGVAGNNLIVRRAWDGSALATHSGSTVYVSRTLIVTRGAVGSTAASHLISAPISRWVPPALVHQRAVAETLTAIEQEQSAYARVVGSGEGSAEARGVGLADLRCRVYTAHGRKARHRAV